MNYLNVDERKSKMVVVKMPRDLRQAIEYDARLRERSMSAVVREVLQAHYSEGLCYKTRA